MDPRYVQLNISNGHGVGSHVIVKLIASPSLSVAFTANTVVPITAVVDRIVAPEIKDEKNHKLEQVIICTVE